MKNGDRGLRQRSAMVSQRLRADLSDPSSLSVLLITSLLQKMCGNLLRGSFCRSAVCSIHDLSGTQDVMAQSVKGGSGRSPWTFTGLRASLALEAVVRGG